MSTNRKIPSQKGNNSGLIHMNISKHGLEERAVYYASSGQIHVHTYACMDQKNEQWTDLNIQTQTKIKNDAKQTGYG